jgi:signal peptidase II
MRKRSGLGWVWVAVVVLLLDRISKYLAVRFLIENEPYPVMKFFNFTLAYNTGAAFSFLKDASGWQAWFFGGLAVMVSVGLLIWLKRISYQQRWLSIAIALIIGGALGNLFDRISYGHVVDFIDWYVSYYHWPVFNIADTAVCIGAVMLLIDTLFLEKSRKKEQK